MNHIFRIVFNTALGTWQAVSELARGRHKGQGGTRRRVQCLNGPIITLLCLGVPGLPGSLWAASLPQNGQVIAGDASITLPDGRTLNVRQLSDKAIIDWQSFSIGKGHTVNFEQTGTRAVALNRVTGNDPSAIYGHLNATGKVFLVNQNGVLFAEGASVNVGGLVASTLDIDNQDFLDGHYRFQGSHNQAVINRGDIHADGGAVALLGGHVSNEGVIRAHLGSVAMAAGERISLDFAGDGLIHLTIDQGQMEALVENHGAIQADGGSVYLTTHAADQVLGSVVNNTGQIQARTVAERGGRIVLLADMQSGTAHVSGQLDASAPDSGDGGFIETSGAMVRVAEGAHVTSRARAGSTGTWLIDPTDFTIASRDGDMTGEQVSEALKHNNLEIASDMGAAGVNGDIFVNDTVSWSDNRLTLSAERDIHINTAMNATGRARLALRYGQGSNNGVIDGKKADYHIGAPVNLSADGGFSTQLGSAGEVKYYGIITRLEALQDINSGLRGNYVLGADIDAGATAGWNNGAGFAPIGDFITGNSAAAFTGTFDGLGHVISDLFIRRENTNHAGLFGIVLDATLRNVGLENVDITGRYNVGGLAGTLNYSHISHSYVTGVVSGSDNVGSLVGLQNRSAISQSYATSMVNGSYKVGGLVGSLKNGSAISQSYATGEVRGNSSVGGLVGELGGHISQAYATGAVVGNYSVGGLVGERPGDQESSIFGGFYATTDGGGTDITGAHTHSGHGAGRTWAELMSRDTFSGWDDAIWRFVEGAEYEGYALGGLPYLTGVTRNEDIVVDRTLFDSGRGTEASPWTITNWHQLQNISYNSHVLGGGHYFSLVNHLGSNTAGYDDHAGRAAHGGQGWNPLGKGGSAFSGTFDGLGHVISDLFINRGTTDQVGLFGVVLGATLRNVGLENVDVTGRYNVGGLAGTLNGSYQQDSAISHAYVTGVVRGSQTVGGLVGFQDGSAISQSHASGMVSGSDRVGGLVGLQRSGAISQSYATAAVRGDSMGNFMGASRVGGLVGYQGNGTISQSYATGVVSGNENVGGLVGYQGGGTIIQSYATGVVSGNENVGGLVGFQEGSAIIQSYATGVVSGRRYVGGLVGLNLEGEIVQSYATGAVTGDDQIGGLVGQKIGQAPVNNSFYATTDSDGNDITGDHTDDNSHGTGRTWAELTHRDTFSGWDIDAEGGTGSVWRIYEGHSMPLLRGLLTALTIKVDGDTVTYNGASQIGTGGWSVDGPYDADLLLGSGIITGGGRNAGQHGLSVSGFHSHQQGYDIRVEEGVLTITAKVIELITAEAASKVYDGTARAAVTAEHDGVISGDDVSIVLTGMFDDKNVGTRKNVTVSGALSGPDAGNYELSGVARAEADITAREIGLVDVVAMGKVYDGTTTADVNAELGGVIEGDDLDVALTGLFDDRNAGVGKIVTVNGALTGHDAGNYRLKGPVTTTADIAAKVIDLINAVATEKVYDGTAIADVNAELDGVIEGDDLGVALTGLFDDRNAGVDKTVTVSGTLHGTDSGNYSLKGPTTTTAHITAKVIDLINAVATGKVYDGTAIADVRAELDGVIEGDDLGVALTGLFDDRNAGVDKTVTVSGTLHGTDSGNYSLQGPTTTTADITAKVIDLINAVATGKVYDGTAIADVRAELDGVIEGDDLGVALTGLFDDRNAGVDKTVTVSGTLHGTDSGNYSLQGPATTTAHITAKVIDLINAVAANKAYDGSADAVVSADLDGVVSGDDLDVALRGVFADARVGDSKTVTVTGELGGGDRGNYQLRGPVQTVASITDPVLPMGYYAAIRTPQSEPEGVPGVSVLRLTIEGEGLNLQGVAGEVTFRTAGVAGRRDGGQQ